MLLTAILFQTIIISEIAQAQEEIKFVGTAIEYFKGGIGGRYGWYVRVDKVIFGPKLEGYIVEVYLQSVPPPWGYMDPDIKPGDTVETYGLYSSEDSSTRYLVSLLGSENYYIKQMVFTKPIGGHIVPANKMFIISPYLTLAVLLAVTTIVSIKRKKRA